MVLLYLLLQLQKVKCIDRVKSTALGVKVQFWSSNFYFQYILLFATVIKGITPTTFNHVIYNISDFLHCPAKIKCTLAAPSKILFRAGKCKKSEMLYIIFSKKNHCQLDTEQSQQWITALVTCLDTKQIRRNKNLFRTLKMHLYGIYTNFIYRVSFITGAPLNSLSTNLFQSLALEKLWASLHEILYLENLGGLQYQWFWSQTSTSISKQLNTFHFLHLSSLYYIEPF